MEHILKSWSNFLRFILGIFSIFLFTLLTIHFLSNTKTIDINFDTDKTLITVIDKQSIGANSVLPACDCWSNTGIEIRPGENYKIKVSGKVHMAFDKAVQDAISDVRPRFGWVGPGGDNNFRIREDKRYHNSDSLRKKLLLSEKANIGQVLFYLQKNSRKPNCEMGLSFHLPDSVELYDILAGFEGKNTSEDTWYLWATVNDMLLRSFTASEGEQAYLGGAIGDTLVKRQAQWDALAKVEYNRLWFDDNAGNFFISAKIDRPKHLFKFW